MFHKCSNDHTRKTIGIVPQLESGDHYYVQTDLESFA